MKILWVSNHPEAPSGYGTQTRQVARRILADGHALEFTANDGRRGDDEWNGCLVRGSGGDRYSRDTVGRDIERSGADWVVSLYDAWVYEEGSTPFDGMANVAGWVPVDHVPAPPKVHPWILKHDTIAMSRFGEREAQRIREGYAERGQTPAPLHYAPHAVDRSVYRPDPESGSAWRQRVGIPQDAFLVGIVAANNGSVDRKSFGDMLGCAAVFLDMHPDAWLYLHTMLEGYDKLPLASAALGVYGIPKDRIRWADQYDMVKSAFSDSDVNAVYNGIAQRGVLLGTSRGEGFGLCHLEAQAAGASVILSNFSASAELVTCEPPDPSDRGLVRRAGGWLVPVMEELDWPQLAHLGKPDQGAILQALQEAHAVARDADASAAYRDGSLARSALWDADLVYDRHWRPILADFERRLSPSRQVRRAASRKPAAVP